MKIFLGGTCPSDKEDFDYRKNLMKDLEIFGIEYFNPVVDDWTDDSWKEEQRQKDDICDVHLYLITPNFKGFYSFAEVLDSTWAYKGKKKCVYGFLPTISGDKKFTEGQIKSLNAIGKLMETRGGTYMRDLKSVSDVGTYLSML